MGKLQAYDRHMSSGSTSSLNDVAQAAGVSLATASRALNGAYGVAASTRARVLEAASELDYVASPEAQRLAGGTARRVALVVPHINRWFFGEMVSGIERVLSRANMDLLLYHVDGPEDRARFLTRLPARRKADAVIAVAFPVDAAEQKRLELLGVQVVAAGGQTADYPNVHIDDSAAGRQAVQHLLDLGHRRIAMIAGTDPHHPDWPDASGRSRAWHEALRDAGVAADGNLVRNITWVGTEAAAAMDSILDGCAERGEPMPTAVFAHSDELAYGATQAIVRRGLRIPEDISIVGIDDHPVSSFVDLTTVNQQVALQGELAAQLLLDTLAGRPAQHETVVETSLVVRGSTAPPAR